jgi:hypothetical protein
MINEPEVTVNLPDPADDRDEPTDEEISEHIDIHTDCDAEINELMCLTTDKEILAWANALRQSIIDAIIEKRADVSDGDE